MVDKIREIEALAAKLKLPVFARYKDYVKTGRPFEDVLLEMLREQSVLVDNARIQRSIRSAGFSHAKTLDTLDVSQERYPKLNLDEWTELQTCEFIDKKDDVVAIGPSGFGKTHAAIAIGYEAVRRGYKVRFKRAVDLINEMREAKSEKGLAKYTKTVTNSQLLIIDEIGYLPYDETDSSFLFQIITARNEIASTFFTTNYEFSKWSKFMHDDDKVVDAVVSRIAHRGIVLNMSGSISWRLEHARSRVEAAK